MRISTEINDRVEFPTNEKILERVLKFGHTIK